MKRLHICCGDIYLTGFCNIDVQGTYAKDLKTENPNKTLLNNYFAYPFGSPRRGIIVDKKMDILLPWTIGDNSVEEVVMISAIEHFRKSQAYFIISEIKRVLRPGGRFIFDFPNIKKQVELYYDTNPEFCMTLLYCNQKDEFSIHHWGYTEKSILSLLGNGWKSIEFKQVVKHSYPMIPVIAIKE